MSPVYTLDSCSVLVGFAHRWRPAEVMADQIMKTLYSSTDLMELARFKSRLFKAGIACEVINDSMTPEMLETGRYPELCVKDNADFLAASLLLAGWQRERPASSHVRYTESATLEVMTL